MPTKIYCLALAALLAACDAKDTEAPIPCDGTDELVAEPGELCPDYLDPDWPSPDPIDVLAFDCYQSPSELARITCSVAIYLAPGHPGDFALESSGAGVVGWNELPWNAEAGPWENAALVGDGIHCGTVQINGAGIAEDVNGDRYFDMVITDDSLGLYTTQRVWLTPADPVIEP